MRLARAVPPLLAVLALAAAAPARAFDFGVGLEGGGTGTFVRGLPGVFGTNVTSASGYDLGVILEQRFDLVVLNLDIWEDLQSGVPFQTGGTVPSTYVPIDAGLRLGLDGLFQPYVGVLVNDSILTNATAGSSPLNGNVFGLGGDVGLDVKIAIVRLGAEFRAYWTLTPIAQNGDAPQGGLALQGLLSARLQF